ncbi:MAG: 2-C-methyl-D-erythritol 4-phosphate cytidylyltransferase, partial [Acidobacteriota bacterium]|nr:2-C-methyl-D-erythritol 4-phosphate cytidylyltransferase [Acidobacteriota bacterium]
MPVAAVVVAAGEGRRFGGPKQFATLGAETVCAMSVRAARSVADRVVLVVPAGYAGEALGADQLVAGGATRADSVRAGLAACAGADVVVVHDAARPLATPDLFARVVAAVRAGADGAVPGLGLTDTVKRVARDGGATVVVATLDRDELVAVQTPQAFAYGALVRAHERGRDATDDAALVEQTGGRVVVV